MDLWARMNKYVEDTLNTLSKRTVIFNEFVPKGNHVNFVGLATKQYIYKQRRLGKSLVANELINYLKRLESIEKYIAQKNDNLQKHISFLLQINTCDRCGTCGYETMLKIS